MELIVIRHWNLIQYIQNNIISTCNQYKIFYTHFFLHYPNLANTLHSWHISVQTGHISHAPQLNGARGCCIGRPVCRPRSLLKSQWGMKRPGSSLGTGPVLALIDRSQADMNAGVVHQKALQWFANGVPSDLAAPLLCQLFNVLITTSGWKYN